MTADRTRAPRALILVENAPVPSDRRVIDEARALRDAGYTVSVIAPVGTGQKTSEDFEGIHVRRFRTVEAHNGALSQIVEYANALVRVLWLMVGLVASPGFDVIEACNPPDLFFLVAWPFRLFGKRFIFDQHDLSPELYSSLYGRKDGAILSVLRWTERRSFAAADAVLSCNESYRTIAMTRGRVPADRVFVVRNGPREGWPLPVSPDRSLAGGRHFLVAYMGLMGFQDGLEVLVEVIDHLVNRLGFTDATFALAGKGSALASLRARVADLGLAPFVRFVGWLPDEESMSRFLLSADACVCPEPSSPLNDHSTFAKAMEYIAAGKPFVAFDLPETRVTAGDAAAYAPPGDIGAFAEAIRSVLSDDSLRARMVAEAARRLPALLWESQIPTLLAAYDCALGAKRDE
jgi:glycosyltransferase involved in cell wall biosynthesis